MPIETEVKIELKEDEFRKLEDRLGNPEFHMQVNLLYELEKGFIRIRYEKGKSYLTIKGESLKDEYNSREEFEVEMPAGFFFDFFKLKNEDWLYYEKNRASIKMDGCIICLDNLGGRTFVEIEGMQDDIRKNLVNLGLDKKQIERRSYLDILKEANSIKVL